MQLFHHKKTLREHLEAVKAQRKQLGFVPTMGALHRGHLSIVKQALRENDTVVVSIFVNPTQFDKPDDLERYPRTLEDDMEKLYETDPGIVVFAPAAGDVYDGNVSAGVFDFGGLEHEMEGRYRKDHFNGVATVVKKLFEIVMPHRAYFGEK
ncbi:MAG: pantoate--beta-alanine ligase, partial [Sinomicrobium sp.]|nr:pantoate--beta-alanine ligase [Sinomicrobium sp.]